MKRKGGGNVQQTSNSNSIDSTNPNERNSSLTSRSLFENRFSTILFTSLIWIFILFVTLFIFTQLSTNSSCQQQNLLQSRIDSLPFLSSIKRNEIVLFFVHFRIIMWHWTCFRFVLFRFGFEYFQ